MIWDCMFRRYFCCLYFSLREKIDIRFLWSGCVIYRVGVEMCPSGVEIVKKTVFLQLFESMQGNEDFGGPEKLQKQLKFVKNQSYFADLPSQWTSDKNINL